MNYNIKEVLEKAQKYSGELTAIRRTIHRFPELGFEEFRTTETIKEYLIKIPGMKILPLSSPTGVIAELPGKSNKTVALRADIDALEIEEKNNHRYTSAVPGVMHACGHDGHIAILLGAAAILGELPSLPCNVRFIFQPAEEIIPSGAPVMLANGALDNVDAVFGFHLNATSDFGLVGFCDGAVMAGGAEFKITVRGAGGHAAYPEKCINPLFAVAEILNALPSIHNCMHATVPCNIVPTAVHAGEYESKIPEIATVQGKIGYLSLEAEKFFRREIENIVQGVAIKNRTRCEVEVTPNYPICINAPELGEKIVRAAAKELGVTLSEIVPSMGSDDFAWYAEKVPAYYMTFGIRKGENFPIAHTPFFDFDEAILTTGAAQFAACALKYGDVFC